MRGAEKMTAMTKHDGLPLSATAVRELVRSGHSPAYLVPHEVAEYIHKRGLYR